MSTQLKAAELQEGSADQKQVNATVLRPLDGRDGFVFAILSVHARAHEGHGPVSLVLEHVERLAETVGKDANAQHRFEQFLSALNETLAERVRSGEWNVPIQNFHALVGIASEEQMFLSGTGDLTALFLHRTPQQRYQVFNLFRSIQTEQALPTWEKAFAVVLDGELHPGDVFCVSNRDLPRFLANEELHTILSTLPPTGAVAKIRQYFPATTDLSLVVVQALTPSGPASEFAKPLASVSLDHLARTKTETSSLLEDQTPKPIAGLMDRVQKMKLSPKSFGIGKSLWRVAVSSLGVAWRIVVGGVSWSARTTVSLTKRDRRSEIVAAARTGTDRRLRAVLGRFNRLPKTTKTLMVAAIGILLVLTTGITVLQRAQARGAEIAAYEEKVTAVEDAIEKAAGAVIYKDENQARKLYGEALALAKALPAETEARAQAATDLQAQIEGAFDELRHLVNIPQPTELGDLGATSGTVGRALFATGGGIYVFASDKEVYLLDRDARALNALETESGEIGVPSEVVTEDGVTLFLDDRPELGRLDLENKLIQLTNVKPASGNRFADLVLYNGKLYVLETSTGQIIKYNPAGDGYDGGTKWIRATTTDLTTAVSIAIDATLFALKPNGQVVRFVGGSEVGWKQSPVDPVVTAATDIWTSPESDHVYVLEPSTSRLIVYKKEGGDLVTQYRSDAFAGLTDFLVDEPNKTIYLLAGTKLFSITASHLK